MIEPRTAPRTLEPSLAEAWARALSPVREELDDVPLAVVEGAVPESLRGVLYRNGPGRLEAFGTRYGHWFDGDGMVVRFAFDRGTVRYRNRFVRTRELEREEREQRVLFRGFGTHLPGGVSANALRMRFKNAANTSVVFHAGKLLALWEAGAPHRLDPQTLATYGRDDLGGVLRNRSFTARLGFPELPFSAHPKIDPRDGSLVSFGVMPLPRPQLILHRVDRQGRAERLRSIRLPRVPLVHDFVLTERWMIFFVPPISFDVARIFFGLASPAEAVRDERAPMDVLLVPRDGGAPLWLEAEPGFLFHFAGGFERSDGTIVVDGFRTETLPPFDRIETLGRASPSEVPRSLLVRWMIHPGRRWVTQEPLCDHPGELPAIAATPHRWVWAVGRRPSSSTPLFTALLKIDGGHGPVRVRDLSPDFPGEPVFVKRAGAEAEDDGYLLSLVYESRLHRSALHVLRADDLSTVCRLALPHHVPPGFHGTWVA